MKKKNVSLAAILLLLVLGSFLAFEACKLIVKDAEIDIGPISAKWKELSLDVGSEVIKEYLRNEKEENPEKANEVIRKLCVSIQQYRAVAKANREVANALKGVPGLESSVAAHEKIADTYDEIADGVDKMLRDEGIFCEEYLTN